jgi:hypothetical protein
MEKDLERSFLETLARALVSLPFDLKVLLEAVSDPDLEHDVRELAAATVVHIINPKDGNVDPIVRHAEDVILLRLALKKIVAEGGADAAAFKDRFAEDYARLDADLELFGKALGEDMISWIDTKWSALKRVVYAKKKIPQFVDDEEVGTFLYDEGLRFGTDYSISDKTIAGRLKQAQPIVDHLVRKRDQDKKKITQS